jgi:hypothetical protein
MGSHIAVPNSPFGSRVREIKAEYTGRKFLCPLTTFALFDNLVTVSPIKLAPAFFHEKAIHTLFYRCTNHGYHILSCFLYKKIHAPQWSPNEERGVDN